ncbi:hypothetical protein FRB91_008153 [Serendipita sp. 411]|nr:hypothetical protein FRC18_007796 [Serendipita sp. 400]KAG8837338.1 hypothetical protein FRB91_008153 [Serendipita sp. 411]
MNTIELMIHFLSNSLPTWVSLYRAYITIGIDSGAEYNITTNNYWDPNFSASSTIAE